MQEYMCRVLFRPESPELGYLPEGPYPCGEDQFSWIAIQHGPDATRGSVNVYDLRTGRNRNYPLEGRPGFAFATDRPDTLLVGLERRLQLVHLPTGQTTDMCSDGIDTAVADTIINDGVVFEAGVVFGCKHLAMDEPKAGLYLWRRADRQLIQLRDDQICSNGKVVIAEEGGFRLLDIDSPKKTVVAYRLDVERGQLRDPEIAIDLRDKDAVPDGMIGTPDGSGVIIAMYNPNPAESGEVRQYAWRSGQLQSVWRLPGSPQATCPLLVRAEGRVQLVVTTAVEDMPAERQADSPNAGCLFIGDTPFTALPETPLYRL